jgi:hypothetical protein
MSDHELTPRPRPRGEDDIYWFDRYAKRIGEHPMSRREVVKAVLRFVAGATSVTWLAACAGDTHPMDQCGGITYDPRFQCCEAATLRKLWPIQTVVGDQFDLNALDKCPRRVPTTYYDAVPEPLAICPPGTDKLFDSACETLRRCYGVCNKTQAQCNGEFRQAVLKVCSPASSSAGVPADCAAKADDLYGRTSATRAKAVYIRAQSYACDCCGAGSCPPPAIVCEGRCVDPRTDPGHCGQCGTACRSGMCAGGLCVCPPGQTPCGAECVDLAKSQVNCGSCGTVCDRLHACWHGQCTPTTGSCSDPVHGVAYVSNESTGSIDCCTPIEFGGNYDCKQTARPPRFPKICCNGYRP